MTRTVDRTSSDAGDGTRNQCGGGGGIMSRVLGSMTAPCTSRRWKRGDLAGLQNSYRMCM